MIFHENRLLAYDSHEISYLIFFENKERCHKFVVCCSRDWRLNLQCMNTFCFISGSGGALIFTSAGVVLLEHFDKRKSLAVGIAWSGASAGTIVIPLLTHACIDAYGFKVHDPLSTLHYFKPHPY